MNLDIFSLLGITLIFLGVIVIFVAILLLSLTRIKDDGKVRGGGALIIGPFPIIFGTDKESIKLILILSLALTVLLIILFVLFYLLK